MAGDDRLTPGWRGSGLTGDTAVSAAAKRVRRRARVSGGHGPPGSPWPGPARRGWRHGPRWLMPGPGAQWVRPAGAPWRLPRRGPVPGKRDARSSPGLSSAGCFPARCLGAGGRKAAQHFSGRCRRLMPRLSLPGRRPCRGVGRQVQQDLVVHRLRHHDRMPGHRGNVPGNEAANSAADFGASP